MPASSSMTNTIRSPVGVIPLPSSSWIPGSFISRGSQLLPHNRLSTEISASTDTEKIAWNRLHRIRPCRNVPTVQSFKQPHTANWSCGEHKNHRRIQRKKVIGDVD